MHIRCRAHRAAAEAAIAQQLKGISVHHLTHIAQVDLPVDICFRYVDTYENVPKWLFGVSEFTPIGQPERGLGTTVSIAAKIGPVARSRRCRCRTSRSTSSSPGRSEHTQTVEPRSPLMSPTQPRPVWPGG